MKAAVVQSDNTAKVEEKPIPSYGANEILIKVVAAGINPTDWKSLRFLSGCTGNIVGCDFVGEVVEIGSNVPKDEVKIGELRCGFVTGCSSPERGGFAEYTVVEWDRTAVIPSNITAEQAASIPIPFLTALQCLFVRLEAPQYPEKFKNEPWILIWSGATAVGQYAIQLAKLSGMRVVTTASQHRWPLLKKLGADLAFDYKDPEAVKKIKEATNDSIKYGIDCVFQGDSTEKSQLAMSPEGGHLITLWIVDVESLPRSKEVKTEPTLASTLWGKDVLYHGVFFKTVPGERLLLRRWLKILTYLLSEGKIQTLDVEVIGGLDATQKGLDIVSKGQNSKKLVLKIA